MTENLVSVTPARVGRKKRWSEDMQARFPEGTFEAIEAVLTEGEDRTDFVREAVERELKRRGRKPDTFQTTVTYDLPKPKKRR